jgi:protein-disulfide isomerase
MKTRISTAALALALLLGGCGGGSENGTDNAGVAVNVASVPTLQQIPAPNNGDWTQVVTQTADGGFLMGNPDAPVKLIEYGSLICPHCADFSREATPILRDSYVRSGQVSWEFRNFLLGPQDVPLSILANCQSPAAFFPTIEQIYEQQREILSAIDEAEANQLGPLPPEQQIAPLARAMDLDTFFARRGMPESRFSQCLANPQGARRLTDITNKAMNELQVTGTPTFFINGRIIENVANWATLLPHLRTAVGS